MADWLSGDWLSGDWDTGVQFSWWAWTSQAGGLKMFKNVAGQSVTFLVIDTTTNLPKTGDSANLTAYVSKDDGTVTVLADTTAAELDATNAPGLYSFGTAQAETNANKLLFSGKSSTSGVRVVPITIYTLPENFQATAITSAGGIKLGDVAHGGSAAVLTLSRVIVTSATTDTAAVTLTGNGTAAGLSCIGGTTGAGASFAGGGTSGAGATFSSTTGSVVTIIATAGNGSAIALAGQGSGHGISLTGGATGSGAVFIGGATSGAAATFTGTAGNANAITLTGQGSAHGLSATGGATGTGVRLIGGATSGAGLQISGTAGNSSAVTLAGQGSAAGLSTTGGATGVGIAVVGGSTSGDGIRITCTNGDGIDATGGAGGEGLKLTGGSTGGGITITGNSASPGITVVSSSGDAVQITAAAGNADGVQISGFGTGSALRMTGGATGSAVTAVGGATSGAAVTVTTTGGNPYVNGTSGQLVATTIATLASQTSFTLTAGSTDDDAYNGMQIVIRDTTTANQLALGTISDYTGSTKTVTLSADPAIFTMAVGDFVEVLASPAGGGSLTAADVWAHATRTVSAATNITSTGGAIDLTAGGCVGIDWANVEGQGTTVGLSGTTVATSTNVTTVNGLAANVITATSIAADAITDAKVAADVTIASVTGAVGSVTAGVVLANSAHGGDAAVLTLERVIVDSVTTNEPAVKLTGDGTGAGLDLAGGNDGHGLRATGFTARAGIACFGGTDSGPGFYADGGPGQGIGILAEGPLYAIRLASDGTGMQIDTLGGNHKVNGAPGQLIATTIATLASQTSFTLTAGSADDDAYNGMQIVVRDAATAEQLAVGDISDYTGSTKTVTLSADPGIFTMAVGDFVQVMLAAAAAGGSGPSAATIAAAVWDEATSGHTTSGTFGEQCKTDIDAILADTNELQTDWVNGGRLDLILDARASQTSVDDIPTNSEFNARTLVSTDYATPTNITAGTITTVTNLTNAPTNGDLTSTMKASVNTEIDAALADIHLDHLFATTYDPTSKPGASDALLNEMIGSDGGVSQWTANALELAPTGGSAPTVGQIADAVWDEALSGHLGSGSTGEALNAAGASGDPWTTTLPGAYTSGQAGHTIGTFLDAAISSRGTADPGDLMGLIDNAITAGKFDEATAFPLASADTGATQLARVGADGDTLETLSDQLDTITTNLATVDGVVDTILVDTNELQADWTNGGRLDLILDARASQTSVDDIPTNSEFDARTLAAANYATASAVATVDGVVDTIALVTAKVDTMLEADGGVFRLTTNALEQAPTGGSAPTVGEIADAVWDEALSGHLGAGSTGEALSASGAAGDPWLTTLPGAYTAGQAGHTIGTFLDAAVSAAVSAGTNIQSRLPAALVGGRMSSDIGSVAGSTVAAVRMGQMYDGIPLYVVDDATPGADGFNGESGLSTDDGYYEGAFIQFMTGDLATGPARLVGLYTGATRRFEFTGTGTDLSAPFPVAPADGDLFVIIGRGKDV